MRRKKKIGFCFTGEGARGSIQAGIAHSLSSKKIKPNLTIGISSGSICASTYAYLGPDGLVDLWSSISNIFCVFGMNYFFWNKSGIMNQNPMRKIIDKALENDPLCESVVSKMNIHSGEMQYVSNMQVSKEDFKSGILGSVAITGLVQDVDGWVDAGSRQLAPIKQCIDMGCNEIYLIMGRPLTLSYWEGPKGFLKPAQMAFRALDISLYEFMIRDINDSIKNEDNPYYKDVNIYLLEPKDLAFDSVCFNKCKYGVEYGKTEYNQYNKKGIKNLFIQRNLI
jgi:predicted patatin/cPLA2 family phospholipase